MTPPRRALFVVPVVALTLTVAAFSAQAEVQQSGAVRVAFKGKLSPQALPRKGEAPVRVAVSATISPVTEGIAPPPLRQITIEINRHGHFDREGLPSCEYHAIQPSTTQKALAACRSSLVGKGSFSSNVLQASAAPFPSKGELYAFNGTYRGRPAILAHVYGSSPIPISYTIPFTLSKAKGAYGTKLSAPMPRLSSEWGYITGLSLDLGRTFTYKGKRHSYVSAGCPTPEGTPQASFKFARASFDFGSPVIRQILTRSCRAHG